MHPAPHHHDWILPRASTSAAVGGLVVRVLDRATSAIALPRTEAQLVVRCGPSAHDGLDVHVMGVRQHVHRKFIDGGHWSVSARLRLGTQSAVLGVPASAITGCVVPLEDLWGAAATEQLRARLGQARDAHAAAALVERTLCERLAREPVRSPALPLALEAAERLAGGKVSAVADDLGISERHLRRVFREAVGVSPKAFAKLIRFHRALHVALAQGSAHASWASIAASTGYYDQAHLIAEFRAIAAATPGALLRELRAAPAGAAH